MTILRKLNTRLLQVASIGCLSFVLSTSIFANPVLNSIGAGQVTVQQTPNSTVVNQTSQKAILNWQSFNIGAQESTHFQQPQGGVALNRINPSQGVSQIYGRLTATGKIILINPAGIFFGPGSYVNVGGLIATTANITDQNFLNNYYHFTKDPGYNGAIVNQGTIIAANHGLIALVGGAVSNDGYIEVNLGQVVLGAGDAYTMTFAGNDLVSFAIDSGVNSKAVDHNGNTMRDGVTNTGSVIANGGRILMTAKDAANVLDHVINMRGIAQTHSVIDGDVSGDGEIFLLGENDNGKIIVAGLFDASSAIAANAGRIILKGYDLTVLDGATFNVSSTLSDGGFVETSGLHDIRLGNLAMHTAAPNGKAGTWLIDPADINITTVDANITGSSPFTPTAAGSTLNVATLVAALASGNVTVLTTNDGFGGSGNITVSSGIIWNSSNTLLLQAFNNIIINAPISGINGTLQLSAVNAASSITTGASGTVDVNNFNLLQGQWRQVGTLPSFNVRNNFRINSGVMPNTVAQFVRATSGDGSVGTPYVLTDVYGLQGMGSTTTTLAQSFNFGNNIDATTTSLWNSGVGFLPIGIVSNSFAGRLNGQNYSITNLYESQPSAVADHMGLFGQTAGATISNLNVVNAYIRLNFDTFAGGILVGRTNNTTSITNVTTSGIVTFGVSGSPVAGYGRIGGMTGENQGTITNSYSTANVSAYQSSNTFINVGGFTGNNIGTISQSYSAGNVFYSGGGLSAGRQVGGFNGANFGTITTSYSTGAVTIGGSASTNIYVGGFAGQNNGGPITNSYSSGLVTNTLGGFTGGFAGQNFNTFTNNFYDSQSSGMGTTAVGAGSATGINNRTTTQMMTLTTFTTGGWSGTAGVSGSITNAASATGTAPNYTWFIFEGSTRPMLMMERKSNITNAHELQMMGSTLGGTYTLANNIDLTAALNSTSSVADVWGTRSSTLTGSGFVPIGGTFTGSLNGNNYTISNLYISRSASNNVGLFAQTGGAASISNLSLSSFSITGASNVGGLAGSINAGTINNVSVQGNVIGSGSFIGGMTGYNAGTITGNSAVSGNVTATGTGSNIGGLVGQNWGAITNASYSNGTVLASGAGGSLVGGLIGWNRGSVLTGSYTASTATVTALSQAYVGGLIGQNDASVVSSYSAATVNGGTYITGGLIGFNYGSISGNTYATGNVTATEYVGGLIGAHQGSAITPASQGLIYATGNVTGTYEVGGLFGENYATVSNVNYTNHTGGVSATGADYVGGIAGLNFGALSNVYADMSGTSVTGDNYVGGLIGGNGGAISGNTYATGNVVATGTDIGGLIGFNLSPVTGITGQQIYATGNVTGNSNVGGLIGNNSGGAITNVYVNSTVTGVSNVGALIGSNTGSVTASAPGVSTVSGTVSGVSNVGAIIGLQLGTLANTSIDNLTVQGLTGLTSFSLQAADISGHLQFIGPNPGNSTLDLTGFVDGGMSIQLSGTNAGTIALTDQIGTISFSQIHSIVASSSGTNTLTGTNSQTNWSINAANSGTVTGLDGTFSNIQNLIGGSGDDVFTFGASGSLSGSINGGLGVNTIIGANIANIWTINANNGGLFSSLSGAFANIQNLVGGTHVDEFNFMEGFSVAGMISGGDSTSTSTNSIRFNTYSPSNILHLRLNMPIATIIDAGTVWTSNNNLVASFEQIQYGYGNQKGWIHFPADPKITYKFYDSTKRNGEVADPFYFFGWNVVLPFSTVAPPNAAIAKILQQPATQFNSALPTASYYDPTVVNQTSINPWLETTAVSVGSSCYRAN